MGQTMNLNFIIGFLVIFLGGAAAIVGIRPVLESQEWTETQIMICLFVVMMIVIAIPPLLMGRSRGSRENKLEKIGKPFTSFGSLFGAAFFNPIGIIILLLIVILNIWAWS